LAAGSMSASLAQSPPGAAPSAPPSSVCATCGVVQSIRHVEKKGEGSGVGMIAGGVVGGLLGHQIGSGRGNTAATIAGAGAGAYGSRFTVNPGLVWAQDFGQRYGVAVTPATQGGIDFAQGGANVTQPSPLIPPGAPQRSLTVQIGELLGVSPQLDRNALYTVWIGSNDILVNVAAAGAGQLTPAQVQANVTTAAVDTLAQIARLRDAGARTIMVFNPGDIG